MPLADYIAEVVQILSKPTPPNGEILVKRVEVERWTEKNGNFDEMFAAINRL